MFDGCKPWRVTVVLSSCCLELGDGRLLFPSARNELGRDFPVSLEPGTGLDFGWNLGFLKEGLREKGYSGRLLVKARFEDQIGHEFRTRRAVALDL